MQLVKPTSDAEPDGTTKVLAVVTRSQRRTQDAPPRVTDVFAPTHEVPTEDPQPNHDDSMPVTEDPPVTESLEDIVDEKPDPTSNGFDFDESLFSPPGPEKQYLTRSQKRAGKRQYLARDLAQREDDALQNEFQSLDITAEQLRDLQRGDPTLQTARSVADGACSTIAGQGFLYKDGLLYIPPPAHRFMGIMAELIITSATG